VSISETKIWRIKCDGCGREEGPIFSDHMPSKPKDWDYETLHDCGLTGYTRHDLLCPQCIESRARRIERARQKIK
jgi:hypothetical protein